MNQPTHKLKVAVLDDYQGAARRYGPCHLLQDEIELTVFADHLHDEAALIERLAPFDVVCLMRERTPMPARVIDALPRLRLIITTATWNAVLDSVHATSRGITVCGTQSIQSGTPELTWLLLLPWRGVTTRKPPRCAPAAGRPPWALTCASARWH